MPLLVDKNPNTTPPQSLEIHLILKTDHQEKNLEPSSKPFPTTERWESTLTVGQKQKDPRPLTSGLNVWKFSTNLRFERQKSMRLVDDYACMIAM
jgi:hypothetical protein